MTNLILEITQQSMAGKIPFAWALEKKLALLNIHKDHLSELKLLLKGKITKSFLENKDFLVKNADNIYIISGGFTQYILPIASKFSIPKKNIIANKLIFDKKGNVSGFKDSILLKPYGKALAVENLNLKGPVIVIGDGYTDYEIKEKINNVTFFAFTENVLREQVVKKADRVIGNLDEFIKESIKFKKEKNKVL